MWFQKISIPFPWTVPLFELSLLSPLEFPIKLHTFPCKFWLLKPSSPLASEFPMTFHRVERIFSGTTRFICQVVISFLGICNYIFLLDVPMSSGVSNIRSKGNLLNCYEFEWDPTKGCEVYVIVSEVKNSVSIIFLKLKCKFSVFYNWRLRFKKGTSNFD